MDDDVPGGEPDPGWRNPLHVPPPTYIRASTLFTLSVHYDGAWTLDNGRDYRGGNVACFDYCDWEYFSTIDVHKLVVKIGQENNAGYWWVPKDRAVHEGQPFNSDQACLKLFADMIQFRYRDAHIYIVTTIDAIQQGSFLEEAVAQQNNNLDSSGESDSNYLPSEEVHSEDETEESYFNSDDAEDVNLCDSYNVDSPTEQFQCHFSYSSMGHDEPQGAVAEDEVQSMDQPEDEDYDAEHEFALDDEANDEALDESQFEAQVEAPRGGQAEDQEYAEHEYALDEDEVGVFMALTIPTREDFRDEDAFSEDDIDSLEEDSEGEMVRTQKNRIYVPGRPWSEFKFTLGMEFACVEQLREALREHFIFIDRQFIYVQNNRQKLSAKCKSANCGWKLYARVQLKDGHTFRVNTFVKKHDCGIVLNSKLLDSEWLAKHFLNQFRMNPVMGYNQFKELTTNTKYSHTSRYVFYSVRKKALGILHGNVDDQYALLEDYCVQLKAFNPGSSAFIKTDIVDGKRVFQRIYICLEACKTGFKHCRQVIGLDGCFLKGFCRGMLLAAVGIDADNSMFPIAYAIAEKENTETWCWFLDLLKRDLDEVDSRRFTIISDRQKGLENAVALLFDGAEVRFCVRHLHCNFKLQFGGLLLKQLLWRAARATTPEDFKKRMDELKAVNQEAGKWLMKKRPGEWSKSHFLCHTKCDMLVNNLCESFNSAILECRDKPIITMLEHIRYWLMRRFCKNRESVVRWVAPVGKRILQVVENQKLIARNCLATRADVVRFQVDCSHAESYSVNLANRTCTCRGYQLTGIPCGHALAAIWSCNLNIMDYIDDAYKLEAYVAQYASVIMPIPSSDKWPNTRQTIIYPPMSTVLPGRPKKNRKREAGEPAPGATKKSRSGQVIRCGNCEQKGHTRRTCKNPTSNQPKIRGKMGRPPKVKVSISTIKRKERKQKQLALEAASSSQGPSTARQSSQGPPPPSSQGPPPPSQPSQVVSEWAGL